MIFDEWRGALRLGPSLSRVNGRIKFVFNWQLLDIVSEKLSKTILNFITNLFEHNVLQVRRVHADNQAPLVCQDLRVNQGLQVHAEKQEHRDPVVAEVVQERPEKTALQVERVLEENQGRASMSTLLSLKTLQNNYRRLLKEI